MIVQHHTASKLKIKTQTGIFLQFKVYVISCIPKIYRSQLHSVGWCSMLVLEFVQTLTLFFSKQCWYMLSSKYLISYCLDCPLMLYHQDMWNIYFSKLASIGIAFILLFFQTDTICSMYYIFVNIDKCSDVMCPDQHHSWWKLGKMVVFHYHFPKIYSWIWIRLTPWMRTSNKRWI